MKLFFLGASLALAQECQDVGSQPVECDPDCANGGLGCGAGGQANECRFCGFDGFPACKNLGHCCGRCCDDFCTTQPTTTKTTTTQKSTTKSTTTQKSTTQSSGGDSSTTKPTKPPSGGDGHGDGDWNECVIMNAEPGELVFEENWDDFNMDIWEHELTMGGGGNWEFQTYYNNRSNSYVRDNKLYIMPTTLADMKGESFLWSGHQDLWGAAPSDLCTGNAWWGCDRVGSGTNYINPINSARLRTVNSFNIKYARLEIEAQLPRGDWLWPAIWMLPKHLSYGKWPSSGEIDIMESRGNDQITAGSESMGNNCYGTTLHWGPFWPANGWPKTTNNKCLPSGQRFSDKMHTFTVDWTSEYIAFELDGEEHLRLVPKDHGGFWKWGDFEGDMPGISNPWESGDKNMAPFDSQFYLIMNLAVGGATDYWSDNFNYGNRKPWRTDSPQAMKDFWDAKNEWMRTWNGEEAALKIGKIRIWQRGDGSEQLQNKFSDRVMKMLKHKATKVHPMFTKGDN